MFRRPWMLPPVVILLACLAVLPACKKKKPADTGDGEPHPTSGPNATSAVNSDYFLFAHLNVKEIRNSTLFADIKQAVTKAGGNDLLNKMEQEPSQELGIKPTDIDTVSVWVPDAPAQGPPQFVLILQSSVPINKNMVFGVKLPPNPDARGFYNAGREGLIHFPDNKTVAMLSPNLGQKYLEGYAKNRSGWPMTEELTKASAGHTMFAFLNVQKIPQKELHGPDSKAFEPLLTAQTVTLTGDLKGKTVSVAARAKFPDATAAGKAKDMVQNFLKMATTMVEQFTNSKDFAAFSAMKPAVTEAQRTLKDAKLEVAGSDLTLAATYKADFDLNAIATDGVKQIQAAATRTTAQNNLKQIGLALHSYNDAYAAVPIHAVDAKGTPLKNATDKPLLSWRVAILPYIEQDALYKQFKLDEPWDSEHNKKLIDKMPKIFAPVTKPGKAGYTHLQMVIGPNALQPFGTKIPISFPDGTSNTIAVVEAADPVIWTKPDDVTLPGKEMPKDFRKKFGGQFPGGFNVLLWDGSVRFVPDSVSDRTLSLAINPNDGMPLPSDW